MPSYNGKFQYSDANGAAAAQGPCAFSFDAETCILTPDSGQPIAFDLGDVDRVAPAEWEIVLTLFTGRVLLLRQFGAAFGRMSDEFLAAWRDRTAKCLLLGDLKETARFSGWAGTHGSEAAAEIRLYETNLAVLPVAGVPAQIRLADVDAMTFDEAAWAVQLDSPAGRLRISKLAKKTDEFRAKLGANLEAIRMRAADALHRVFPFLDPDQLRRLLALMPEGRSASLRALAAIHPKLPEAMVGRAVDAPLKPYFDALRSRSVEGSLMAGFKFIREDEVPEEDPEAEQSAADGAAEPAAAPDPDLPPMFFWFFFQMAANPQRVAWEASTGTGRATYFFRIPDAKAPEAAVQTLTRGLALVNFRREPVYLPDASLEQQQRFHRYAIGARKLADLRTLRSSFAGRAIHTTVDAWTAQVDAALART